MSDDVDDTTEEGDVTSDEGTESDGGVDVSTGDVGTDGDGDEKCECMGDGGGDETGGGGCTVVGELVVSDSGT